MEKIFILVKLTDSEAVLRESESGLELSWPPDFLPPELKVGDRINCLISSADPETAQRQARARDILNEILNIED